MKEMKNLKKALIITLFLPSIALAQTFITPNGTTVNQYGNVISVPVQLQIQRLQEQVAALLNQIQILTDQLNKQIAWQKAQEQAQAESKAKAEEAKQTRIQSQCNILKIKFKTPERIKDYIKSTGGNIVCP